VDVAGVDHLRHDFLDGPRTKQPHVHLKFILWLSVSFLECSFKFTWG
jgi:hypothetical protein